MASSSPSASLQSLKGLEAWVRQADEALRGASARFRELGARAAAAEAEAKRLREELRAAKAENARHARLRSRLEKLASKLERIP